MDTLVQTNGSTAFPKGQAWLQMPVQKFFTAINWEDQPPEVQEIKQNAVEAAAQGNDAPLSLMLSVSQFFGAFPWDGNAMAMNPPILSIASSTFEADGITLDDFSDLF
ncbi:MAG: hypothetical protein KME16_07845 [Scytolyngbya sp. HA4215-MV1]|nr:hypothetical protein [Scytolyngbya sp. HA4215-MV1]